MYRCPLVAYTFVNFADICLYLKFEIIPHFLILIRNGNHLHMLVLRVILVSLIWNI